MALKKYHGWIVQKIFQVSHPAGAETPGLWGSPSAPRSRCGPPAPCPCRPPRAQEGLSSVCLGEAGAVRGLCCTAVVMRARLGDHENSQGRDEALRLTVGRPHWPLGFSWDPGTGGGWGGEEGPLCPPTHGVVC